MVSQRPPLLHFHESIGPSPPSPKQALPPVCHPLCSACLWVHTGCTQVTYQHQHTQHMTMAPKSAKLHYCNSTGWVGQGGGGGGSQQRHSQYSSLQSKLCSTHHGGKGPQLPTSLIFNTPMGRRAGIIIMNYSNFTGSQ